MYLYSAFDNTYCFKAALQKMLYIFCFYITI